MQRKSLRLIAMMLIVFASLTAKANPVDMRTSREVAMKFVNANAKVPLRGAEDLQLVTTYSISRGGAAFHVFNTPNGFVIVAADDCATPILGYSDEGRPFDTDNVPIQLQVYLQWFVEQIQYGIENNIQPDEATAQQWELVRTIGRLNNNRDGEAVEPLITTQWGQGYPYNALCPEGTPTGCTATATAQIMNYWQYPTKGLGYHSYEPNSGLEAQSVWFNETYYQWDQMDVDHVEVISTLMYHVGVAMNMDYSPGGSSAYLSSAQNGLQRYFDYSESSIYLLREDYDDSSWIEMLKSSLMVNKPVLYEGYGSIGHAWIVDGFDSQNMFHMNFGWSGSEDGYYSINALTNIGWYNFNYNQGAVFGICPKYSPLDADFEMVQGDSVLKFNFYDYSRGAPNQYIWHFGDGESSTMTNPVHVFDTTGLYQIMLVVSNESEYDTIIKDVQITIPQFIAKNMCFYGGLNPYFPPMVLDYDLDGNLDFYASGCFNQQLYHNEGSSFSKIQLETSGESVTHHYPAIVDFNHENRPSIITSEKDGYYWHNNNGTLERRNISLNELVNGQAYLVVGDYNGDGEDDIMVNGILYQNLGGYRFVQVSDIVFDSQFMMDYDGDGDLDFVGYWIYRNDGDDVFTCLPAFTDWYEPWRTEFITNPWSRVKGDMADMDGDGDLDFLAGDNVWYNAEGILLPHGIDPNQNLGNYQNTLSADINSDGITDIIARHHYSDISVWKNNLDSLQLVLHQEKGTCTACLIDYDNNNIPDLAIMAPWGQSEFLENTCTITNNPPSIPQNLWADTTGNSVVLRWDTVFDDHSRYGSITYNLMVGTEPNGYNIKSPLSDIETGKRYAYNKGNAGYASLWKLNNLPNGTYYWRVQAIDNSLAASQFSETGVFVINGRNLPPQMSNMAFESFLNRETFLSIQTMNSCYSDRENDTLQGILITRLPNNGHLFLRDSPVNLNQYINYSDIENLRFITSVFCNDSLFVKAYDGFSYAENATLIRFEVNLFEQSFLQTGVSGAVAWGDYDNDGKVDFACTSGIYHNLGAGFELLTDSIPLAENVVWVDVDNDGWLDCLFDGFVLTNRGNGQFLWNSPLVDWGQTAVAFGDVNNDNTVDYVISGSPNHMEEMDARLYYNEANTLSNDHANNTLQGFRFGDIAMADFDNDGRLDIVMDGISEYGNHRSTLLYRNNGDGAFYPTTDSLLGLNAGSLCVGDYNSDGAVDLLICGTQGSWDDLMTDVYDNNGTGMLDKHIFPREINPFAPIVLGQAKWYDFDNDGFLDVILSGIVDGGQFQSGTHLYKNVDGIYFEEINTALPNLSYSHIDIADYDNDGYSDILISGTDRDGVPIIAVYNNCMGIGVSLEEEATPVPANLVSDVTACDVTLSWDGLADVNNTYNVYVRNNEGFVVSPMADTVSGFRKVVKEGNVGLLNHYEVKNLPYGTYYWSVQSVSNALKGSLFAEEQSFSIIPVEADTVVVFETACHYFGTGLHTYKRSGVYYERYEREPAIDSVVELHLTINHDCTPIVYVAQHPVSYQDGCSWESAYSDLQFGIDMALAIGADIWVAEGEYYGDGVSDHAFYLVKNQKIYGGFSGNERPDYDLALRDFSRHPTILDGQNTQTTILQEWWGDALVDGFTIRNGLGSNAYAVSLHLNNCILQGSNSGSEVYSCEITNSIVENHSSMGFGCSAKNTVFVGPDLSFSYSWSSFSNCIFWNYSGWIPDELTTYSAAQGRQISGEGNILLAHSNNGNAPDSLYVRFVDPENGDFRLLYGSACINAGTPDISELGLPQTDLLGNPRVMDGRIDMGAFEYNPSSPLIGLSQGWSWYAPTVQTSVADIETALGSNLLQIQSKDGILSGNVVAGEMYKIQTTAPCTLAVTGVPITSATITINPGENWFGFVGTEKTVAAAFTSFTPAAGDKVISQNEGFAVFENGEWHGTLETLQPSKGYVYVSNATEPKTLVIGN